MAIGENRPVTVVGNGVMPLQAYIVKNTAQSAANLVTAAQGAINTIWHYDNKAGLSDSELDARFNEAVMDYMLTALARTAVFESVEAENGSSVTPAEYFTAALIVVFMMFAGMPGMKMLVSERGRRYHSTACCDTGEDVEGVRVKAACFHHAAGDPVWHHNTDDIKTFSTTTGAPVRDVLILFGAIILAVSAWSVFTASISPTRLRPTSSGTRDTADGRTGGHISADIYA